MILNGLRGQAPARVRGAPWAGRLAYGLDAGLRACGARRGGQARRKRAAARAAKTTVMAAVQISERVR